MSDKDKPFFSSLEAATGFEPVNNGFADRCLSHLAMPPSQPNYNMNLDRINRMGRMGNKRKISNSKVQQMAEGL